MSSKPSDKHIQPIRKPDPKEVSNGSATRSLDPTSNPTTHRHTAPVAHRHTNPAAHNHTHSHTHNHAPPPAPVPAPAPDPAPAPAHNHTHATDKPAPVNKPSPTTGKMGNVATADPIIKASNMTPTKPAPKHAAVTKSPTTPKGAAAINSAYAPKSASATTSETVPPATTTTQPDPTTVLKSRAAAPAAPVSRDPVFYQEDGKSDLSGAEIFDITSHHIFNREHHKIYIRVHQLVFDKVLEDGANDVNSGYGLVDEFYLDGDKISNVGIKVRGNTSAANIKRQFKFKFDLEEAFAFKGGEFKQVYFPDQDDRRFFGEHGFSVRASQNDPSKIREMLSGKVFRETALQEKEDKQRPWTSNGGLVYRAAFATLYVTNGRTVEEGYDSGNPEYRVPHEGLLYDPKGLYVITENIDKTFISTRFERFAGEKVKGTLYQADHGKAYFQEGEYSRDGWKLELAKGKKPKDEEDRKEADETMIDMIRKLRSDPSEEELREMFDMDSVNAYLSAACLCTHWDSLAANRNNDFMFYWKRDVLDDQMNPICGADGKGKEEKKWYMITWDLDNTLWDEYNDPSDVRNPYRDWFSNYIYQPAEKDSGETRLIEVLFNSKKRGITRVYDELLLKMLKGFYGKSEYEEEVDELSDRVKDAIEDTRKAVSEAGWQKDWGEYHNPKDYDDIKEHARVRRSKIGSQLD